MRLSQIHETLAVVADDPGNAVLRAVAGCLAGAVAAGAARGGLVDPRRASYPGRDPHGGTLRCTDGSGS